MLTIAKRRSGRGFALCLEEEASCDALVPGPPCGAGSGAADQSLARETAEYGNWCRKVPRTSTA